MSSIPTQISTPQIKYHSPSTQARKPNYYSEALNHFLIDDLSLKEGKTSKNHQDSTKPYEKVILPPLDISYDFQTPLYEKSNEKAQLPSNFHDASFYDTQPIEFLKRNKTKTYLFIEIIQGIHILREWKCSEILYNINNQNINKNFTQKDINSSNKVSRSPSPSVSSDQNEHKLHKKYSRSSHELLHSQDQEELPGLGELKYRDCRQVLNDVQQIPSIEVRKHCIVICLPPVTSFILHDRVFLLVLEDLKADSLIQQLIHISQTFFRSNMTMAHPFEFMALECLISSAFQHLNDEIMILEDRFSQLEKKIQKSQNPTSIIMEELHYLKEPVSIYNDRVNGFDKAFNFLIADTEELKYMELTKFFENPELHLHHRKIDKPNADLLILLEYFDQELDQFHDRVNRLNNSIVNADRLLSLRLSINRNKLIKYDLGISLFEAAIALGMCISGIFGMNLKSGIEQADNIFLTVTFIILIVILLVLPLIVFVWKRMNF